MTAARPDEASAVVRTRAKASRYGLRPHAHRNSRACAGNRTCTAPGRRPWPVHTTALRRGRAGLSLFAQKLDLRTAENHQPSVGGSTRRRAGREMQGSRPPPSQRLNPLAAAKGQKFLCELTGKPASIVVNYFGARGVRACVSMPCQQPPPRASAAMGGKLRVSEPSCRMPQACPTITATGARWSWTGMASSTRLPSCSCRCGSRLPSYHRSVLCACGASPFAAAARAHDRNTDADGARA